MGLFPVADAPLLRLHSALALLLLVAPVAALPLVQPASANPAQLDVMSFNIRYGTADDGENSWPHRREAVIAVIEAHRPHVLGLQEAEHFQLEEIGETLPRYRRLGVGRTDGEEAGEYAAVLVDGARLEVLEQGTFWFSDTPGFPGTTSWGNDIPRICTWARLRDRETDRSFAVYNVHWDHRSQPSRERSAELLSEVIAGRVDAGEPVIVTGDFNAGEANPAFRRLLEPSGPGLADTFRILHPEAEDVGTFNGFEGRTGGEKIDAVLASDEWVVAAAEIVRTNDGGRYPSDHFPVVATLRLAPPRERQRVPNGAGDAAPDEGAEHAITSSRDRARQSPGEPFGSADPRAREGRVKNTPTSSPRSSLRLESRIRFGPNE